MKKDKIFNTRSMLVLVFEVLLVVIAIGGITFATSTMFGAGSSTIITFGDFNVDYLGKTEISFSDLEPISDKLINYNIVDDVIRLEFSLRGVDTNENPDKLIYDVMITDMNIDCSLLNEYTKWNLYKNGELIYNGNFSPKFDGNVLTDNFKLTETQQRMPLASEEYDNYVLLIWISESCDDLLTCEWIDQSQIVNSIINMKVFIAVSGGTAVEYERIPNTEATCINKPVLENNMIPVYYDSGFWKVADKTNFKEDNRWYDYDSSKWANAVIVNTDIYKDSELGTIIKDDDIDSFYVWVPRFKYKLWNDENTIESYDYKNKGIDIVFESGVHSTGDIKCTSESCIAKANKYLTHPAFSNDLRGIWVGKYEIDEVNKSALEYKTMLGDDMISNLDWGATLYLSHSKYGICNSSKCERSIDSTTNNQYGVYDMFGGVAEYNVGSLGLGSATNEMNLYNYIVNENYVIRGAEGEVTTRKVIKRSSLVN